jgi:hypothetical protein
MKEKENLVQNLYFLGYKKNIELEKEHGKWCLGK